MPGTIFDGHAAAFYWDSPQVRSFMEGDLCDYTIAITDEGREAVHILPPAGRGPNSPEARAFAGLPPLPGEDSPKPAAQEPASGASPASDSSENSGDSGMHPVYREFRSILIARDTDVREFENRFSGDRRLFLSIPYHFSCSPGMPCSRSMVERHLLSLAESMGFNAVLSNGFSGDSIAAELEWIPEEENGDDEDADEDHDSSSVIRVYHIEAVLGYFAEIAEYTDDAALAQERNRKFYRKKNLILEAFNKHRAVKATGQRAVLVIALIGITLVILLLWQLWKGGNYLLYQIFG